MTEPAIVPAAGAVVLRRRKTGTDVLLVHRPKYDDWSFPKGKLDPGEGPHAAAVREVEEETGVRVRLGPPLTPQTYLVTVDDAVRSVKTVRYWVATATGDTDVAGYAPNAEIDGVRWVPADKAAERLSYAHDRETLVEALLHTDHETTPLVVLRHAVAVPKKTWTKDDEKRPLDDDGTRQAEQLTALLAAYGVRRLVSSSSKRCWATLQPYADAAGLELTCTDGLTKDAAPDEVALHVRRLVDADEPAVLCTHRETLPHVFAPLGLAHLPVEKGAMVVVHHHAGRVAALEPVPAPA